MIAVADRASLLGVPVRESLSEKVAVPAVLDAVEALAPGTGLFFTVTLSSLYNSFCFTRYRE